MRKSLTVVVISLISIILSVSMANAILITSNILVNPTVIDFSQFANNQQGPFEGPVQVGGLISVDVALSGHPAEGNDGAYLWNRTWGLRDNGYWNDGRFGFAGYDARDNRTGTLLFSFNDNPVSAVGAFINDAPDNGDLFISAFDAEMNLLESYDICGLAPIRTPDAINDGAFRGIALETSLISHFGITGYLPVADDLAFTSTPVPEPSTILLLVTGFLGLVGAGRKKIFNS